GNNIIRVRFATVRSHYHSYMERGEMAAPKANSTQECSSALRVEFAQSRWSMMVPMMKPWPLRKSASGTELQLFSTALKVIWNSFICEYGKIPQLASRLPIVTAHFCQPRSYRGIYEKTTAVHARFYTRTHCLRTEFKDR